VNPSLHRTAFPRAPCCPSSPFTVALFISRPFGAASSCVLEKWNLGNFTWLGTISSTPSRSGHWLSSRSGCDCTRSSFESRCAWLSKSTHKRHVTCSVCCATHCTCIAVRQRCFFVSARPAIHTKQLLFLRLQRFPLPAWGGGEHNASTHTERLDRDPTVHFTPSKADSSCTLAVDACTVPARRTVERVCPPTLSDYNSQPPEVRSHHHDTT
jgi:hypothetical protein